MRYTGIQIGQTRLLFRSGMSTSTSLKTDTGQPPGGNGGGGSFVGGGMSPDVQSDSGSSLGDASSMMVLSAVLTEMTVVMPDGSSDTLVIDEKTQVMDALVQISANHKLNPAQHKLVIVREGRRPVDCKPSQMVGSLGVATLHMVNKKAEKERQQSKQEKGFEMKARLQLNLPHGQLFVTRVSSTITLAEIFKMVCDQKGLDPYKHELRHPTKPDVPLNMSNQLAHYNLTELSVINITAADASHSPGIYDVDDSHSLASTQVSNWTSASMAHSERTSQASHNLRKKKGLLSLFSRKKEGKFKPSQDYTSHTLPHRPPSHHVDDNFSTHVPVSSQGSLQFTSSKPVVREQEVPHYATLPKPVSKPAPKPGQRATKKRPAPPPPPSRAANGSVPSGRDVSPRSLSPDERTLSEKELKISSSQHEAMKIDAENISPPASVVSEYTVMSSVSQPHRPRQRKKRRAPVPPSGNVMMETASIPEVIPELPEGTSTQDLSAVDTAQAVLPPIGGKLIHEEASSMQPQMAADVVDSAAAADVGASQEAAEAALSQLDSDLELASANPQGAPGGGLSKSKKQNRPSIFSMINDPNQQKSPPSNKTGRPCEFVPPPPPQTPPPSPPHTQALATQTSINEAESVSGDEGQSSSRMVNGGVDGIVGLSDSFSSVKSGSNLSEDSITTLDDIQNHFESTIFAAEQACIQQEGDDQKLAEEMQRVTVNGDVTDGHARNRSFGSTISTASVTASYDVQLSDDGSFVPHPEESDVSENSSVVRYDFTDGKLSDTDSTDSEFDDQLIDDIIAHPEDPVMLIGQRRVSDDLPQQIEKNNNNKPSANKTEIKPETETYVTVVSVSGESEPPVISKTETNIDKKVIKPQAISFDDSDYSDDQDNVVKEILEHAENNNYKDNGISFTVDSSLPECEEIELESDAALVAPSFVTETNKIVDAVKEVETEQSMMRHDRQDQTEKKTVPGAFIRNSAGSYKVTGLYFKEQTYDYTKNDRASNNASPSGIDKSSMVKSHSVDEANERKKVPNKSALQKREEIVISLEDLRKIDMSPHSSKAIPTRSQSVVEKPSLKLLDTETENSILSEQGSVRGQKGHVRERCSDMTFTPKSEGELEHVLEEKSIMMMSKPTIEQRVVNSQNRYTSEPQKTAVDAALVARGDASTDDFNITSSNVPVSIDDQTDNRIKIQRDYQKLKNQFSHWQKQLEKNEAFLSEQSVKTNVTPVSQPKSQSSLPPKTNEVNNVDRKSIVANDLNDAKRNLKPVTHNVYSVSSDSLRSSLKSHEKKAKSGLQVSSIPSVDREAGHDVPPPPPPPTQTQSAERPKPKRSSSRPRFEPQLDPREELMIAIRNAGGRSTLKKVPVSKTKWYERKINV